VTLDDFIDQSIKEAVVQGYTPTTFMRMRNAYGTVEAIRRLVETCKPQSGFYRLKELGLYRWFLEAAVLKFPSDFSKRAQTYAQARLDGKLDA
jgi:hypothetical protein